jgi:glutaredoxin
MVRLSGRMAVPVIVINGDVMVGFDQKVVEEKLHKKK